MISPPVSVKNDEDEEKSAPKAKVADEEKDTYWDALEGWNWDEEDSKVVKPVRKTPAETVTEVEEEVVEAKKPAQKKPSKPRSQKAKKTKTQAACGPIGSHGMNDSMMLTPLALVLFLKKSLFKTKSPMNPLTKMKWIRREKR